MTIALRAAGLIVHGTTNAAPAYPAGILAITGAWQGPATAHPTIQGATVRQLDVPLTTLTAGLWGLVLVIPGDADLFLGNVYIE